MSSRSVLITGAAGFIGSHLTERCLALGWHVIAVDSFTEYYHASIKRANLAGSAQNPNCTVVAGDLLDLELGELLEGVTIAFHLAAQPGVRASWEAFDLYARLNVNATHRLLHAARNVPLERFVIASSSSIYGDAATMPTREDAICQPVSPYGITKVAAEHLAQVYWRNFAVPTVALRYFTVYGPRQRPDMALNRFITHALTGRPIEVFGDGTQTRDFTFVTDAVTGTIAAGQRGKSGSVYNIGGGSRRSVNSVLDTLGGLLGCHVERRYLGHQPGDARDTSADISRAQGELGFEPSLDFGAGLKAQLDWQRTAAIGSVPAS
jgi:nucleoside-diphosphate-sugar epimerase